MCRSLSEGGRRCPCDSGERKRARQNAGNRAKRLKKQFEQGTKKEQEESQEEHFEESPQQEGAQEEQDQNIQENQQYDLSTVTNEAIYNMTDEQRHELREYARERIIEMKEKTTQSYDSIARSFFAKENHLDENFKPLDNFTDMSPEEAEEYFQEKKHEYMEKLYQDIDMMRENKEVAAYESNVRELGESVHAAALITTYENMQNDSITPQDVVKLGKEELYDMGMESEPNYRKMSGADKYLIHAQNKEKYKKQREDIDQSLEKGEPVDPDELFAYISNVYGTDRASNDTKYTPTLYPNHEELQWNIKEAVYNAKITMENDGVDISGEKIHGSSYQDVKQWKGEYVELPTHPVVQKELLDLMDETYNDLGNTPQCKHSIQKKALIDLEKKQHKAYIDAIKQESGQSFGKESVKVEFKNSNIKKAELEQFENLSANFPDSMIENSSKKHNPLKLVKENSFYRKDASGRIIGVVYKRAHFRNSDLHEGAVKQKLEFYSGDGNIRDDSPSRTEDNEARSSINVNMDFLSEMSSGSDDDPMTKYLKKEIIENMDKLYVRTDNTEAMQRLQEKVNEQNTPTDNIFADRLFHRKLKKSPSKSKPIQVEIETFTDDFGIERAKVVSKNALTTNDQRRVSVLTTDGVDATTQHELSHYVEKDPRVHLACKKFLYRRTEGLDPVIYNKGNKTNGYKDEIAVPDDFVHMYIGKDYEGRENTEVFSMGMQYIFTPDSFTHYRDDAKNTALVSLPRYNLDPDRESKSPIAYQDLAPIKEDYEHRNLILGLISSSQKDN